MTAGAMERAQSLPARASAYLRAWLGRDDVRLVALWWGLSRLWLVAATVVGAHLRAPSVLSQPTAVPLWQTWRRWDAAIYAHIATHGYVPAEARTTPAFFPLFPLAQHLVAPLTGGDPYLAGLLLANIAWFVALRELFLLTCDDVGYDAARGAVLALSVFPTALFGFVPYPESLFLALAIAAFRRIRRRCWLWAGILGGLAALTRQAGVLLMLPYLWEALKDGTRNAPEHTEREGREREGHEESQRDFRATELRLIWNDLFRKKSSVSFRGFVVSTVPRILAPALLIPLGLVIYAGWLWHAVGDPLAFWHAQATWHRATVWPWQTLWRGMLAVGAQPSRYFTLRAWQELLTVLGMGALCLACLRRAPASYAVFAVPLYLLFLAQTDPAWPLLSEARFMLEIFPLFVVLGQLVSVQRWRAAVLIAACLPVQVAGMIIFSRAGWFI